MVLGPSAAAVSLFDFSLSQSLSPGAAWAFFHWWLVSLLARVPGLSISVIPGPAARSLRWNPQLAFPHALGRVLRSVELWLPNSRSAGYCFMPGLPRVLSLGSLIYTIHSVPRLEGHFCLLKVGEQEGRVIESAACHLPLTRLPESASPAPRPHPGGCCICQ